MRSLSVGRLLFAFATIGVLLGGTRQTLAQDKSKPEKVRFETFDGVELHGSFYPSHKGNQSPCVLMLHNSESNRSKANWDSLARTLQEDYAVLTFDFRGHGDSDTVQPQLFWSQRMNQTLRGYNPNKTSISVKDFSGNSAYWPMLVNDVAAAKRFLDRQNDAGRCNSSNTILVAAGDACALASLFMASEWKRQLVDLLTPMNQWPFAGKDIAGAVWLSFNSNLRGNNFQVTSWFTQVSPQIKDKVPMYFLCGEGDSRNKTFCEGIVRSLKQGGGPKGVDKLTGVRPVDGSKSLAGMELLKDGLKTKALIAKYVEEVMDKRGAAPPQKKDIEKQPVYPVPLNKFGFQQ
jgi:hypothetical protein